MSPISDVAAAAFATAMARASGRNNPAEGELQTALARSLGEDASVRFFEDYSNVCAHFDQAALRKSLQSYMRLHGLRLITEGVADPQNGPTLPELVRVTAIAFLELFDRGAIKPEVSLNAQALADLENMKLVAGRSEAPPVESIELQIEKQVILDWTTLPSAEIKQIMKTTPAYRKTVERLAAEGRLP